MKEKVNQALLVMDMQPAIVSSVQGHEEVLKAAAKCIQAARENNIPVIYVMLGFRLGMPEINDNNVMFRAFKERMNGGSNMKELMQIHPTVTPLEHELVVVKRRVSAFTGSDLEVLLKTLAIDHLVLTGVSTSGVVLSTFTEAAGKDFKLTVVSDACLDRDEEVHRVLTTKFFIRYGTVLTSDAWCQSVSFNR